MRLQNASSLSFCVLSCVAAIVVVDATRAASSDALALVAVLHDEAALAGAHDI